MEGNSGAGKEVINLLNKKSGRYLLASILLLFSITTLALSVSAGLFSSTDAIILLCAASLMLLGLRFLLRKHVSTPILILLLAAYSLAGALSVPVHELGHSIICIISGNKPTLHLQTMECTPNLPEGILYPIFLLSGGLFSSTVFLSIWLLSPKKYPLHSTAILLPVIILQLLNGLLETLIPCLLNLPYKLYVDLTQNLPLMLISPLLIFTLVLYTITHNHPNEFRKQNQEITDNLKNLLLKPKNS